MGERFVSVVTSDSRAWIFALTDIDKRFFIEKKVDRSVLYISSQRFHTPHIPSRGCFVSIPVPVDVAWITFELFYLILMINPEDIVRHPKVSPDLNNFYTDVRVTTFHVFLNLMCRFLVRVSAIHVGRADK